MYFNIVTVPHKMVGLEKLSDCRGVGLQRSHCTVKPVYKDHLRDQVIVVSVDRLFLCRGAVVLHEWFTDQHIVVSIDGWSHCTSGL